MKSRLHLNNLTDRFICPYGCRPSRLRIPVCHLHLGSRSGHIHIPGTGQAKVNLFGSDGKPELVSVVGIKQSDMRRLMSEVAVRRDEFLQEWERIHGERD